MDEKLNRREFLTMSALAAAGLSVGACVPKLREKPAGAAMQSSHRMAGNITPIAIADDCIRLVLYSGAISEAFKQSLTAHHNIARAGGVMRSCDKHIPILLSKCRDGWASQEEGDIARILAFTAGGLCHLAADRELYPAGDVGTSQSPTDREIYHDAVILREIYLTKTDLGDPHAAATNETMVPADIQNASTDDINDLFYGIERRTLIRLHTFECDAEDIEGWISKLMKWRQANGPLLRRYAEVYRSPDPAKTQRFIDDVNFYDNIDPVIRLARSLQHGEAEKTIDLDQAVEAAESQSQYSRALRKGFLYLQVANAYFTHAINEQALRNGLEIK